MPLIESVNGLVAAEPFKNMGANVSVNKGFALMATKDELISMRVVFETSAENKLVLFPGDYIYVTADAMKHEWAAKVFKLAGAEFVLVPEGLVKMAETSDIVEYDGDGEPIPVPEEPGVPYMRVVGV